VSDYAELRAKLVEEADKALHRKGIDPSPCSCQRRKRNFDFRIGRIEELSDQDAVERSTTPYVSVACADCGKTQFYLLPLLIGVEAFNKIAGDHLGRIV
jgi:hypothetical protein